MEHWRDIPGHEGRYQVSDLGNVRGGRGLLKPQLQNSGYLVVHLYMGGRGARRVVLVHRAVAFAFLPNPQGLGYVNHIDGDKSHNAAANLEWCTNSENVLHARATLPFDQFRYGVIGLHKLTHEVVRFDSQRDAEIALSRTGKQSSAIHHCLVGTKKSAYGYVWRREE